LQKTLIALPMKEINRLKVVPVEQKQTGNKRKADV
jgi:hypothetical protein